LEKERERDTIWWWKRRARAGWWWRIVALAGWWESTSMALVCCMTKAPKQH